MMASTDMWSTGEESPLVANSLYGTRPKRTIPVRDQVGYFAGM
jgi:hypothetical protein